MGGIADIIMGVVEAECGVSGASDPDEATDDCLWYRACIVAVELSWSEWPVNVKVTCPGNGGVPSPTLGVRAGGVENSDMDEVLVWDPAGRWESDRVGEWVDIGGTAGRD